MDEERDSAKNLAEALREVKAMQEGKLPEQPLDGLWDDISRWIEEAKNEAVLEKKAI